MKVELWMVGKTNFGYLKEGIELYEKRLKHYLSLELKVIPDLKNSKNLKADQFRRKEGDILLQKLQKDDFLILLDEKGKEFSSISFSKYMEDHFLSSKKRIVFLIGGAFGFSKEIYERSNSKITLSKMTFSHQMVRLFIIEQLYRSFTILKNEPYHHR